MFSLRSQEAEKQYQEVIAQRKLEPNVECRLCAEEPTQSFAYWKILPAAFPYDLIAKTHDMILPIRHVSEEGLTEEEKKELLDLKKDFINPKYEYIIEGTHRKQSMPGHFHLHLLITKDAM